MSGLLGSARKKLAKRRQKQSKFDRKETARRKIVPNRKRTRGPKYTLTSNPLQDIYALHVPGSKRAKAKIQAKVLQALNKLIDVDTRKVGTRTVINILSSIAPQTLPMILSCLYHIDWNAKPLCRREYILLIGEAIRIHGSNLEKNLSRIINNLVKRCQDADSRVREACADTFADLVTFAIPRQKFDEVISSVFNSLFKVCQKADSFAKAGASQALQSIFLEMDTEVCFYVSTLCPRLLNCWATNQKKVQIHQLSACRALIDKGKISVCPWLPEFLAIFVDHGRSSDWLVREQSILCLKSVAQTFRSKPEENIQKILSGSFSEIHCLLEKLRFDKIVNVRNEAAKCLKIWTSTQNHIESCENIVGEISPLLLNEEKESLIETENFCELSERSWFQPPSETTEQVFEKAKKALNLPLQNEVGNPKLSAKETNVNKINENQFEQLSTQMCSIISELESRMMQQFSLLNERISNLEVSLQEMNLNPNEIDQELNSTQEATASSMCSSTENQLWSAVVMYLNENNVHDAYHTVLYASDDLCLVRLIMETGAVFDIIEEKTIHGLVYRIVQMIQSQSFLQNVIPYLHESFSSVSKSLPSLPPELKSALIESLENIPIDQTVVHLAQETIDLVQHCDICQSEV